MKTQTRPLRKHPAGTGRDLMSAGRTDLVALTRAVAAIRADSVKNGTDAVTLKEINGEISRARASRR